LHDRGAYREKSFRKTSWAIRKTIQTPVARKPAATPPIISVAVLVSDGLPGRVSSTAIRVAGRRANTMMKVVRMARAAHFHRPA
jgi:hypothetical protein